MMSVMSTDAMSKLSHFRVPKELLLVINKELNAIKKVRLKILQFPGAFEIEKDKCFGKKR